MYMIYSYFIIFLWRLSTANQNILRRSILFADSWKLPKITINPDITDDYGR